MLFRSRACSAGSPVGSHVAYKQLRCLLHGNVLTRGASNIITELVAQDARRRNLRPAGYPKSRAHSSVLRQVPWRCMIRSRSGFDMTSQRLRTGMQTQNQRFCISVPLEFGTQMQYRRFCTSVPLPRTLNPWNSAIPQ